MALFAELAAISRTVAATSSRLAKVRALAEWLRALAPDEIPIAIAFLTGETRQGKLGIAYAALRDGAWSATPTQPTLTLEDVDAAFVALVSMRGKGSAAARTQGLDVLFGRATREEREFLSRLIVGELRQGALKGLMLDAIAAAAKLPLAVLRRAAMSAGGLQEVARAVLTEGAAGLARFSIRLMQPLLPMLSHSALDVDAAAGAFRYRGLRVEAGRRAGPGAQGGRAGAGLHAQPQRRDGPRAGDRRDLARLVRRVAHTRRRGDRLESGRHAARVSDEHASLRSQARSGGHAAGAAAVRILLRLPVVGCRPVVGPCGRGALLGLAAVAARSLDHPAHRHGRARARRSFLRRRARTSARGCDGQGTRPAVRSRASRRGLAQAQAYEHAGSRGSRRRMGQRPAQGLAFEPAPGRARSRSRRLRHAGEDLQGTHRSNARMADARVPAS